MMNESQRTTRDRELQELESWATKPFQATSVSEDPARIDELVRVAGAVASRPEPRSWFPWAGFRWELGLALSVVVLVAGLWTLLSLWSPGGRGPDAPRQATRGDADVVLAVGDAVQGESGGWSMEVESSDPVWLLVSFEDEGILDGIQTPVGEEEASLWASAYQGLLSENGQAH